MLAKERVWFSDRKVRKRDRNKVIEKDVDGDSTLALPPSKYYGFLTIPTKYRFPFVYKKIHIDFGFKNEKAKFEDFTERECR